MVAYAQKSTTTKSPVHGGKKCWVASSPPTGFITHHLAGNFCWVGWSQTMILRRTQSTHRHRSWLCAKLCQAGVSHRFPLLSFSPMRLFFCVPKPGKCSRHGFALDPKLLSHVVNPRFVSATSAIDALLHLWANSTTAGPVRRLLHPQISFAASKLSIGSIADD